MKKRNLLLSLLLAGSLVTPVFAEQDYKNTDNSTTYISKTLKMAEGTQLPQDMYFKFNFVEKSFNDTPSTKDSFYVYLKMPKEDVNAVEANNSVVSYTVYGDVFAGKTFEAAGIYTYTVTEDNTVYSDDTGTILTLNKDRQSIDYSKDSYAMTVYVANSSTSDGTEIEDVVIKKDGDNTDSKVDAGNGEDGKPNTFNFINIYKETTGSSGDGDDPVSPESAAFSLTKEVTTSVNSQSDGAGSYNQDKYIDYTKDFTFAVTVSIPETFTSFNYKAYTVKGNTTTEVNVSGSGDPNKYDFTLKHGEKFYFDQLPVGTTITVSEKGTPKYTPSANYNGSTVTNTGTNGDLSLDDLRIEAGTNTLVVTNDFDATETMNPTGIIINNLPYILLVVVGVAGIALYEAGRRRFNN